MEPRHGLAVGSLVATVAAAVFMLAPVSWFGDVLEVSGDDASRFLVRRYASSATAALAVVAIGAWREIGSLRATLLGFAAWFGVQGSIAIWGLVAGTVGGVAWLAAVADPLLCAWFSFLAGRVTGVRRRGDASTSGHAAAYVVRESS